MQPLPQVSRGALPAPLGHGQSRDEGKRLVQAYGSALGKNRAGSPRPVLSCLSNTANTPAVQPNPRHVSGGFSSSGSCLSLICAPFLGCRHWTQELQGCKVKFYSPSKCKRGCGWALQGMDSSRPEDKRQNAAVNRSTSKFPQIETST